MRQISCQAAGPNLRSRPPFHRVQCHKPVLIERVDHLSHLAVGGGEHDRSVTRAVALYRSQRSSSVLRRWTEKVHSRPGVVSVRHLDRQPPTFMLCRDCGDPWCGAGRRSHPACAGPDGFALSVILVLSARTLSIRRPASASVNRPCSAARVIVATQLWWASAISSNGPDEVNLRCATGIP